jgi:UDP-N-acetylmuramoyl-L-alanyl-D-glutamate--2,6-diaminopimelate ligase
LAAEHDGPVVTVGLNSPAELTAIPLESHRSEQTFLLSFGREVIPVRSTLLGAHNIGHCLTAAAVGTLYGVRPEAIVRGIESVKELPGRLERVECGQPFGVFLDEARTPQALEMCLETLRSTTTGRLRCLYASPAADVRMRIEYETVVRRWCDDAVIAPLGGGLDRAEAIRRVLGELQSGDCLLIVGDETAETDEHGDDRLLVRRTLFQLAHDAERRTVA